MPMPEPLSTQSGYKRNGLVSSNRLKHVARQPHWRSELEARRVIGGPLFVSRGHDVPGACHSVDASDLFGIGKVNRKDVPPLPTASNQIFPPCASMIVRQIDRPTPMPLCFEVMNG